MSNFSSGPTTPVNVALSATTISLPYYCGLCLFSSLDRSMVYVLFDIEQSSERGYGDLLGSS